ncbi:hypothetical protein [Bailinhaonella thermotolerans]|uniref:Uncharacterized protein n=1 Tax=Bailinhaonella thermotolerans TaxID=1070861 RepID=A0A3A4AK00_9ACTN|nr:hypothetical protein [Bailinhaonella thermotolerans]RJL21265.1 hypothetical protein D5H75_38045 [Bailinhaonella thermotolerans]
MTFRLRRLRPAALTAAALTLTLTVARAAPAAAATCTTAQHCYGLALMGGRQITGIRADLGVVALRSPDPAIRMTTAEMWLVFGSAAAGGWVELGQIHGVWCWARRHWFSAAAISDGFRLHCHEPTFDSSDKTGIRIERGSAGKWNTYIGGAWTGTTYTNGLAAGAEAHAGSETTPMQTQVNMAAGSLGYRTTAGAWVTGWDGAVLRSGPPYATSWITQPRSVLVKAPATAASGTASTAAGAERPWRGPVDPVAEASRLARLAGRDLGPAVTTVAGVPRRAATAALGGDTVADDRPVTVVQARGRFGGADGGRVFPPAGPGLPPRPGGR